MVHLNSHITQKSPTNTPHLKHGSATLIVLNERFFNESRQQHAKKKKVKKIKRPPNARENVISRGCQVPKACRISGSKVLLTSSTSSSSQDFEVEPPIQTICLSADSKGRRITLSRSSVELRSPTKEQLRTDCICPLSRTISAKSFDQSSLVSLCEKSPSIDWPVTYRYDVELPPVDGVVWSKETLEQGWK